MAELSPREVDNVLRSMARYIAGCRKRTSYWRRLSLSHLRKSLEALRKLARDGARCPFCGMHFRKKSALVSHLIRFHRYELLEILERNKRRHL